MSRVLVTGGAGFIGSNFVRYWLKKHPGRRVVILDALTYAGQLGCTELMKRQDLRFVHGDICEGALVEALLREERLDTIVHFAAESHVDRSINGPDVFLETNVMGTHALLKAARRVWMVEGKVPQHRFHHISTDEVYGSADEWSGGFNERTPYAPNSPYSATKAAADHLVRAYHRTYGLQVTTSNCSNNYGPYQFPEKLIPRMITNLLSGSPLGVYGDGLHVREWLHVEDHCRAIDCILQNGKIGETYNVGGGAACTNLEVVEFLCQLADEAFRESPEVREKYPACPAARDERTSSLITLIPDRPGHDRRYTIDGGKIERELGYSPAISLERGLRDTFFWYVENEWWWQHATSQKYVGSDTAVDRASAEGDSAKPEIISA